MIYQPSDDSYLLEEQVKVYSNGKSVLDLGSGSGIQAKAALQSGAKSVLAVDIDLDSLKHLKSQGLEVKKSNLFKNIKEKFDLIVFNPPYLPENKDEDKESALATTGGKKGDEIILRFLKNVKKHLSETGIVLLLLSSLTPREKIMNELSKQSLDYEVLSSKKLFFENLEVWKIHAKV